MRNKINKKYLLALAMTLATSGCIGSGIETPATQAIKEIPPIYPTVSFGTPSATTVRTASAAATIALNFADAKNVSLTTANIGVVSTGGASCTIGLTGVTNFSAIASLTACTGNGSIGIYVKANSLVSSTFTNNVQSGNSSAVTVDNAGPTISTFTPATGPVAASPTSIVVTFSEAVRASDIVAGLFVTTASTCSPRAVAGTPVMSAGNTVATIPLTGATCTNSQTTVVSVNMTGVHDTIGNTGTGTTVRTYTFTDGPTVSFAAPSVTRVRSGSAAATVVATFTNAASAPSINTSTVGLTTTGGATCPTITGSVVSASAATLNISGCTGNGTVAAHMNAGSLVSSLGFPNVQSSDTATITVDNTGPTVSSMLPATSTVSATGPGSLVVTFSEAMDGTTVNDTDFVITGTCASPPMVGTPVMSGGNTVATVPMTGGSCADTTTVIVTYAGSSSTDTVGNPGTGMATQTYTYDTTGPTIMFAAPSVTRVSSASAAATIAATFGSGTTTPTLTSSNVGLTTTGGATCSLISGSGASASGATINISNCTGNGTIAAHINASTIFDSVGNGNLLSSDAASITVDNAGPTVVVTGVNVANADNMVTTVTATFNEAISNMTAAKFTLSGSCGAPPALDAGSFLANGANTVFTIDLDGSGTCAGGETLSVSVDAATVSDTVGNVGSNPSTSTHTF